MSTESHQKILPDYEDLITSLNITSSINLSNFSRVYHKPVWFTDVSNVVVPSDNLHGFLM